MLKRRNATELAQEAKWLGVSPPPEQVHSGVWISNVSAVEAFLEVTTQFHVVATPDGVLRRTGLNYQSARAAWDLSGAKITPDLFARVQMIEHGALAEWSGR